MHRVASSLSVLLVLLALSPEELRASDAVAAPSPKRQSLWEREYAAGDWGGQRTLLSDRGVLFTFTYAADALSVASGGIRRGTFYNGFLDLGTDIDFEKLVDWKGTHFHVNGFYPHGEDGSANYVGDIGTFSNIEAYDTYRLYEPWVEQKLLDGRFSLRVGQITLDSEFAVLDAYGGLFVQSGFGAPEAFSANLPLPVFPNAAPGVRARFAPVKGLSLQAAVFDGNVAPGLTPDHSPNAAPSMEFNRHGTDWALRADEGALLAGEISYGFNQVTEEEASATRTTADSRPRAGGGPAAAGPEVGSPAGPAHADPLSRTKNWRNIVPRRVAGQERACPLRRPRWKVNGKCDG